MCLRSYSILYQPFSLIMFKKQIELSPQKGLVGKKMSTTSSNNNLPSCTPANDTFNILL